MYDNGVGDVGFGNKCGGYCNVGRDCLGRKGGGDRSDGSCGRGLCELGWGDCCC